MRGARAGAWTVAALREPPAAAFGVSISRMSVWRDVQEAGRNARRKQSGGARGQVRVIGEDETVVRVNGEKTVAGVVTGAETGQVLGLDLLVERDSDGFDSWSGLAASRAVRDGDTTLRRMRAEPVGKWRAPLRHRRRGDVPWANSAAERAIGGLPKRALGRDVEYGFQRNRGRQRDFVQFGEHLSHPVFRGLQGLRPFGSLILSDHPAGGSRRLPYSRIASLPCGASIRASCRRFRRMFRILFRRGCLASPPTPFS